MGVDVKRFVVPPNWPTPPRRSWIPPKTWTPDPSWPAAPKDWKFWVDGRGNPVRGPIGRYAGLSSRVVYAGAAALVLVLVVNVWALNAIGLFGGDSKDPATAGYVQDDRSPSPSDTPSSPTPSDVPTTPPPMLPTTATPTPSPTPLPTKTRTTTQPRPTPTATTTTGKPRKTPKPPRRTPREEQLRQYCIQRGIDPKYCNPDNWQGG